MVDSRAHDDLRPSTGDHDLNPFMQDWVDPDERLKPAAVLVPLVEHNSGLTVLLTKRTDHLHHHAEEEIGLDRAYVEVAGYLDNYETGTGFHITPVVGFVRLGFDLNVDDFEVADVFEVPLDFLFDPKNHQRHSRDYNGHQRQYYAMPYGEFYIWGATAGMLMNLYRRVHDLL